MSFKIVKVDYKYCNYLRKYDNKVSYNAGVKELRPFVGVLFKIDDMEYFAPLSSPKEKHKKLRNTVDLIKIDNGNLGVINLNNMIPVSKNNYNEFDINQNHPNISERKRSILLYRQLRWLNSHERLVIGKAIRLYDNYKKDRLINIIKDRCCNYPLLEEKCAEYNK